MYTDEQGIRHPVIGIIGHDATLVAAAIAARREDIMIMVELPKEEIETKSPQSELLQLFENFNKDMEKAISKVNIKVEKLIDKEQCNKSTKFYKRRSRYYF